MLYPEAEQKLQNSKQLLDKANSENIVERCKVYLALLDEYRTLLYELPDVPGPRAEEGVTPSADYSPNRSVIREAIETTTRERNRTKVQLLSYTTVSGYEAVDVFNERKHEGHEDWELRASGVKFAGGDDSDMMTIQEAVDLASQFRREDQIAQNSARRATEQ